MTSPTQTEPNRPYRGLSEAMLAHERNHYQRWSMISRFARQQLRDIDTELAHRQRERAGKAEG